MWGGRAGVLWGGPQWVHAQEVDGALPHGECQPWDSDVPPPRTVVSTGAVEGKRQVQPRGVGSPLHPTVMAAALVSLPERWQLSLWHLGPALVLGAFGVAGAVPEVQQLSLWLRDGRGLSPLPDTPSAPAGTVPKAGGSDRAAGRRGLLLPSIPVPAPVGATLKPPIDFPTPVGGSMSSRPLLDGDTLR